MAGPWRIRAGEFLGFEAFSSIAGFLSANARVRYDNGQTDILSIPELTLGTDRASQTSAPSGNAKFDGFVTDGVVGIRGGGVRGRTWASLSISNSGGLLAAGYATNMRALPFGLYEDPGPEGGSGFLSWVQVFHDRAGNAAAVDFDLFATNALRKIYGVAWYYHCDNTVANRLFNAPYVSGLGGPKPTGFTLTGTNAVWGIFTGAPTLTADEEGAFLALSPEGNAGRMQRNDNGTGTAESSATNPSIFPFTVTEDDTDTIMRFQAITTGQAGDTHSAYVLMKEWLVI